MACQSRKKGEAKKVTKRAVKKAERTAAKKAKGKKPHKAKATDAKRPMEKSITEVAATHLEHMPFSLGYLIP